MQDKLKEMVAQERDAFEVYSFDVAEEWQKVAEKIEVQQSPSKKTIWRRFAVAAAIGCVMGASIMFMTRAVQQQDGAMVEMEQFYQGQIEEKITLVKNQMGETDILEEFQEMDDAFAELKKDLNDDVDNEEVIVAMMESYRLKLRILEEILMELEKEKDEQSL